MRMFRTWVLKLLGLTDPQIRILCPMHIPKFLSKWASFMWVFLFWVPTVSLSCTPRSTHTLDWETAGLENPQVWHGHLNWCWLRSPDNGNWILSDGFFAKIWFPLFSKIIMDSELWNLDSDLLIMDSEFWTLHYVFGFSLFKDYFLYLQ